MKYSKKRCPVCSKKVSVNGVAWTSHMRKHVREGAAKEVDTGEGLEFEFSGSGLSRKAKAEKKMLRLMQEWDLTEKGWTFRWDNRSKKTLGRCWLFDRQGNPKVIELSSKVWLEVPEEELPEGQLEDTMLHEIAHALDFEERGKSDHGAIWKGWASHVGADPSRTCEMPEKICKLLFGWMRKCKGCGEEFYYAGKPRKKSRACRSCCDKHNGGKYSEKYLLEIKRNPHQVV